MDNLSPQTINLNPEAPEFVPRAREARNDILSQLMIDLSIYDEYAVGVSDNNYPLEGRSEAPPPYDSAHHSPDT